MFQNPRLTTVAVFAVTVIVAAMMFTSTDKSKASSANLALQATTDATMSASEASAATLAATSASNAGANTGANAAATTSATSAATQTFGEVTSVKCNPTQISVSPTRIHVKCSPGVGKIVYFAVSTADQQTASNYLMLMTQTMIARKQLLIDVLMDDMSGESYGCKNADCRPIQAIAVEQ